MHSAIVIHEFLPSGICGRAPGSVDLVIREGSEQTFETLKNPFLNITEHSQDFASFHL